jgi:plastocyanin
VAVAPEATATTAAKENADSSTISAVLREWALDLSANEVAAGKVTFSVTNQGSMGHNLTVVDSSGSVVGATPTFRKSEGAQSLEVTLAPGTYTVLCSLPGHAAMGQKAQLVVK